MLWMMLKLLFCLVLYLNMNIIEAAIKNNDINIEKLCESLNL